VIRRTLLAVGIVLGALTLSSCSSVDHPNAVATVDDAVLTRDDLDQLLNNRIVQEAVGTGELDGDVANVPDQADRVISIWIVLEAISAHDAAQLDDEATANSLLTGLGGDYQSQFDSSTGATRDLITRYIAFQTQYQAGTLDADELRAAVQAADVHVDSRYGYWDEQQASVFPFGSDADTPATT
jgi:hypothetical protein